MTGLVRLHRAVFPERFLAAYVIGSYADASSIPLSDLDMLLLFRGVVSEQEIAQVQELVAACGHISPIRLDIGISGEHDLSATERTLLKLGSMLVYGEDIRAQVELPSIADYQRDATWGPYRFLGQILRGQMQLRYPLAYPDASAPFYGYAGKRVAEWYPAEVEQGIKEWVTGVLRTATALLALEAGRHVAGKRAAVEAYRAALGDEWSDYLEAVYQQGKHAWRYLIPAGESDQALLNELCARTLAFENHYFARYRRYLLGLLSGSQDDQCFALERLTQVVYADQETRRAVAPLCQSDDPRVCALAQDVLIALGQAEQGRSEAL